jgi:cardiolipin synthase A/B
VFENPLHFLTGGLLFTASEWLIRLVMLFYVPQRRTPAAARTWLLLIFILPWIGLLLYMLFGRPFLPRRRLERLKKMSALIESIDREFFHPHALHPELPERYAQAVALAENLGNFPICGGNQIELLTDYDGAVACLIADIDAAEHHVHLLYYLIAPDRTGLKVAEALSRAVKRGVSCRVLMDSLGSKKARRRLIPWLREAGVEVIEMLRFSFFRRTSARVDLRNHRKLAVIDGRIGYVGSQNLVDAAFLAGLIYEELVARVTGPVVLQLQTVFVTDRFQETDEPLRRPEFFPPPQRLGQSPVQTLPSGPGYPLENNQRLLVALMYAARKRIVVTTPYFIPDEPFQQAMQTAVLAGVEVHLVVSRQLDQLLVGLAQRSYYEDLLESGIKIHVYHQRFLHAKHVTIDDSVALIGSSNMDIRSFALNAEISLLVYDPQVVAELRTIQERYFAASDLLTLEEWHRRSVLLKTVQNVARLVDSLL